MNGLPYYKSYPRDFIEGTIGLTFEVKAAYRLVLDLVYMQGGNLPDDPRYISGLLGLSVRKWKDIRGQLVSAGKLAVNGEFLTNYRAVKELEMLSSFQEKQSENRSRPNKNKEIESPRSHHTEPDTERKEERALEVRTSKGADAPRQTSEKALEAEVFAVGKDVLGKSAGGVIQRLRKACEYDDTHALEWLRKAAEKQSPIEWISGVLKASESRAYVGVHGTPPPDAPIIESKDVRSQRAWEEQYYASVI